MESPTSAAGNDVMQGRLDFRLESIARSALAPRWFVVEHVCRPDNILRSLFPAATSISRASARSKSGLPRSNHRRCFWRQRKSAAATRFAACRS